MQQVMNESLWVDDFEKGEIINALAAAPPKYSEDFKTMTIKIREGMFWSDGKELTADDLAFTVEFIKNAPAASYNASVARQVESAKATDKTTVEIKLKEAQPALPFRELLRPVGQPVDHAQACLREVHEATARLTPRPSLPSSTTRPSARARTSCTASTRPATGPPGRNARTGPRPRPA